MRQWSLRELPALSVGVIPLGVYVPLVAVTAGLLVSGALKPDIMTNIAVLAIGGFSCGEIGKRIPLLRQVGAAAILATFLPSLLVYLGWIPKPMLETVSTFTKSSNFLYLFIASIVVGSILGMDRRSLIAGFLRIAGPLFVGSICAVGAGLSAAFLMGLDLRKAAFEIIIPIMAGGVGEGAIPLSIGYATLGGGDQGTIFARILPAVMMGSLTAIVFSGVLNMVGRKCPGWTGDGVLTKGEHTELHEEDVARSVFEPSVIAAAMMLITLFYLMGVLAQQCLDWPAPVVMLGLTVLAKLMRIVPSALEQGAFRIFAFFRTAITYPLLFAIGASMTPWDELMDAMRVENVVTIVVTVSAMMGGAFLVADRFGLYPIDTAIVAACHSGQGGTGDVAILSAANRLRLMPFAQIATRIGGAITVTVALLLYRHFALGS